MMENKVNQQAYDNLKEKVIGKIHHFGSNGRLRERLEFDLEDSISLDWNSTIEYNGKTFILFNKFETDETKMTDDYISTKNYITHIFVEESFNKENV